MTDEIKHAIAAHGAWKGKLRDFMAGRLELKPEEVVNCNTCEFGKWMLTNARATLGANFTKLDGLHRDFHKAAADVVRMKNSHNEKGAEESMSPSGAFTKASSALVQALMALP